MQRNRMSHHWRDLILALGLWLAVSGSVLAQTATAPAAPSYAAIVKTIEAIGKGWGTTPPEAAAGWQSYFEEVRRELDAFAAAKTSNDRLGPLNRLWKLSSGLEGMSWAPANELREALRSWLRPRVRLAWAERRLIEALEGNTSSPDDAANRKNWSAFVDGKLGAALRDYEGAKSVQARQEALKRLRLALGSLRQTNPWAYSTELRAAADDLFNAPNLDVSADLASLYPVLANQVVTTGPIYRHGYVSQVTAGAYAGFRLLPSDQGIAFDNSQYLTSVTPITDFQQQIAADKKGRRAAKMYQFSATSTDNGLITVTAILTPFGLQITQNPMHNFDALICAVPAAGGGLSRLVASALGFGEQKIVNKVYEGAIGQIRQNANQEAAQEASERIAVAQAQQNEKLSQFLHDGTLTIKDISIAGLSLRSRPENALIGGTIKWTTGYDQGGADLPRPPIFAQPASGISADVHLASAANNVVGGYLSSPEVADVQNLMIEARKIVPGTAPKDAVKITKNVDFATYIKKVDEARAANNPDVQVLRIKRPKDAPDFAVDANGHLVVIAHDLQLEVPVPAQVANSRLGGASAKVYHLVAATAEFVFEIKPVTDPATGAIRLTGNLIAFTPAPGSKVFAINDDEAKALPLDPFRSVFIFQGFATAIKAKPLDIPLENVKLRGYAITNISNLDPTGWMRIVLTPTGERPLAQAAP